MRWDQGKKWREEEAEKKGAGAKLSPRDARWGCTQPLRRLLPTEVTRCKAVRARNRDVYYPAICSLPKITATDMRSTEDASVIDTCWS